MIIDSHQHFWKYDPVEFNWIPKDNIRRSFDVADLANVLATTSVSQVVSVQARCNEKENDYLLEGYNSSEMVAGVVGWIDLSTTDVDARLESYSSFTGFKGVREIIQGQPDKAFLTNEAFIAGVNKLQKYGLTYDLLVFSDQLASATSFVDRCPSIPMVLDHAGKPDIKSSAYPTIWEKQIRELAKRKNVCCKFSGLVTEIRDGSAISVELMRPYFDTLLEAFGPERLMFGSDWPVCLLESKYHIWLNIVSELIEELSSDEQQAIYAKTAKTFYSL